METCRVISTYTFKYNFDIFQLLNFFLNSVNSIEIKIDVSGSGAWSRCLVLQKLRTLLSVSISGSILLKIYKMSFLD